MRTFAKSIDDRKELVRRLSELTGEESRYTFMPRCAYEVGAFTVEKDGRLTVGDGADGGIIEKLKEEGLIGTEMGEPPVEGEMETEPEEAVEAGELDETETEEPTEAATAAANDELTEGVADEEAAAQEPAGDNSPEPLKPTVSFPMSKHTARTLTNLICMVYSRGPLLSKATGGEFHADRDFVDGLLGGSPTTVSDLVEFLRGWGESDGHPLTGISFTEDKVTFDGFPATADADAIQAFMKLAAAMNRMALTQKRVQAKEVDDANEKYALRIWLVRLGLSGDEYKADRKILMGNLSGNSAFRNEEEKERWTARQAAKRDALRAAKAATVGAEASLAEEESGTAQVLETGA